MQKTPELLQAEREADKCLTELITLKNQTVDMMHKHLDKAREYAELKAKVELLRKLAEGKESDETKDKNDGS